MTGYAAAASATGAKLSLANAKLSLAFILNDSSRRYHTGQNLLLYYARRSYFAPANKHKNFIFIGGDAGYRPRVRNAYSKRSLLP